MYENKRVAIITGCSSGLGKALCEGLKANGYYVVATARNLQKLQKVKADLKIALDVTQEASIQSAFRKVEEEVGRVDLLINNAGYSVRAVVEEINQPAVRNMFDVNVFGMLRMMQEVLPIMRKQGSGRIMNIGSISGRMTGIVNGGYCASKYAVEAISEAARYELSEFGIEVTVIEPGAMDTGFFDVLAEHSGVQMENADSPYRDLYQRDIAFRGKQNRTKVEKSVQEILGIVEKKKWKTRYMISLSWVYKVFIHLPDGLKEIAIKKFN